MARSFGRSFAGGLASAIIKERNRRNRQAKQIELRYQKQVLSASIKAEKEKYINDRIENAKLKTDTLLASYDKYCCLIKNAYENKQIFNFDQFKKKFNPSIFEFSEPLPNMNPPRLDKVPKIAIFSSQKKKRLEVIQTNLRKKQEAENEYQDAIIKYNERKKAAQITWENKEAERKTLIDQENLDIEEWEKAYCNGDPKAVEKFVDTLFKINDYSEKTIDDPRFVYIKYSKKLIINFHLKNSKEEIFYAEGYRYIKQRDDYTPIKMKVGSINERLKNLLIELNIATFIVLFKNDIGNILSEIIVNTYYDCICCVSSQVKKDEFINLDLLSKSDKAIFLENHMRICKQLGRYVKPFENMYINLS